jgi:hypothetical protein
MRRDVPVAGLRYLQNEDRGCLAVYIASLPPTGGVVDYNKKCAGGRDE